ncbi:DUF898 domain-containing protein [Nitrogeniibacter mangrovi]|uniref:DUF898 domain-containing protein n=1 Tax=Nitrogeniibacter mangrovi TaxID=2016596 RepID=A0A6C1BAK9_9RHOO|nr:YjgN family protein [Nitrogeniibacter mangrovi]QID19420.1 DUF898 domain-containing protein [Nitrogeniibacter mangrovi]
MNAPDTLPAQVPPAPVHDRLPLSFTGSGGAYFRIWIVNVLLSIVTLGIYSAWAKVRRERYFLNNTVLDRSPFEYHADPIKILKGRLLVVSVLIVGNLASKFNPFLNLLVSVIFLVLLPWMISRAMRFRAHNTSWRGLRFRFTGTAGEAAKAWILWPIAAGLTLGILTPYALAAQRRYLVNHLRFGNEDFEVDLPVGPIYRMLLGAGLVFILVVAAFAALGISTVMFGSARAVGPDAQRMAVMSSVGFVVIGVYVGLALIAPYISVRLTNLVLNRSNLGDHGFLSQMRARRYMFIVLTNWLLTAITLGLYRPFAVVRLHRYRVEHIAMLPAGSLDDFVAVQEAEVRVLGEEAADLLDIDLGF